MRSQPSTVSAIAVIHGLRRCGAASGHGDLQLGHPMSFIFVYSGLCLSVLGGSSDAPSLPPLLLPSLDARLDH